MVIANGIAVTASITTSAGHEATWRKNRSVEDAKDRPPRCSARGPATGVRVSGALTASPMVLDGRHRPRTRGTAWDSPASVMIAWMPAPMSAITSATGRSVRDELLEAVLDRRDDGHALGDERQQRDVRVLRGCGSAPPGRSPASPPTVAGSERTDSRDGVSSAPAWAARPASSLDVRNWTSSHAASLFSEAVFIQVPNGCTSAQWSGLTSWQGSDVKAVSSATSDFSGSRTSRDRARVVVPHRDAALLEGLEAVGDLVGRDAFGRGGREDVTPELAELARVGLLRQEDVPLLVEVVAGDGVVVGVEPLPELERVVERLGDVGADAEPGVVVGGQLLGVVEELRRGSAAAP